MSGVLARLLLAALLPLCTLGCSEIEAGESTAAGQPARDDCIDAEAVRCRRF
jgi:hypothetical protein